LSDLPDVEVGPAEDTRPQDDLTLLHIPNLSKGRASTTPPSPSGREKPKTKLASPPTQLIEKVTPQEDSSLPLPEPPELPRVEISKSITEPPPIPPSLLASHPIAARFIPRSSALPISRLSSIVALTRTASRIGEEKLTLLQGVLDWVNRHIARIDADTFRYEGIVGMGRTVVTIGEKKIRKKKRKSGMADHPSELVSNGRGRSRQQSLSSEGEIQMNLKKKRRKKKGINDSAEEAVLYCACRRVSFGTMILCDGPSCDVEWVSQGLFLSVYGYHTILSM
jgi:hypothetical protein